MFPSFSRCHRSGLSGLCVGSSPRSRFMSAEPTNKLEPRGLAARLSFEFPHLRGPARARFRSVLHSVHPVHLARCRAVESASFPISPSIEDSSPPWPSLGHLGQGTRVFSEHRRRLFSAPCWRLFSPPEPRRRRLNGFIRFPRVGKLPCRHGLQQRSKAGTPDSSTAVNVWASPVDQDEARRFWFCAPSSPCATGNRTGGGVPGLEPGSQGQGGRHFANGSLCSTLRQVCSPVGSIISILCNLSFVSVSSCKLRFDGPEMRRDDT